MIPKRIITRLEMLLACLVILFVVSVVQVIVLNNVRANISVSVNIAGRNRMLSQRMAFLSERVSQGDEAARNELQNTLDLYQDSLLILKNGGYPKSTDHSHKLSSAPTIVQPSLDAAIRSSQSYIVEIQNVIHGGTIGRSLTFSVNEVRKQSASILAMNDQVVNAYVEYDEQSERRFRNFIVFIVIAWPTLIGMFIAVMSKNFSRLKSLTQAAIRMSQGAYSITFEESGDDEITTLSRAYNTLGEQIRKSLSQLEQRVAEKTAALQEVVTEVEVKNDTLQQSRMAMLNLLEDLRRDQKRDEVFLSSIGEGLIATDEKGKIVIANHSFEQILGWKAEEAVGKHFFEVITIFNKLSEVVHEKDHPLSKVLQTGKRVELSDHYYQKKDGTKIPIALVVTPIVIDGRIEGTIEVFRDISQDLAEKEQLQDAERNLEEAQRIGNFGSFVWDLRNNHIRWSLNSFLIHGFVPSADSTPPPMEEYFAAIHPEDRKNAKESLQKAVAKEEHHEETYRVVWPDESVHFVKVRSQVSFDEQHKPKSMKGTFQDITKEMEVDRMKTEFISLASHQLRTPLTAVKWFTEMLIDGDAGKLENDALDFVKKISESNERMIELVNALLNISRIESGRIMIDPVETDLGDLVRQVLSELENKLQNKKLSVVVSVHPQLPKILIDPKMVRQVYLNFLTNAIKYTPEGGEISIFLSKNDTDAISQVTDTGYGIPLKEQDRVFQKFYRGENIIPIETEGTGLGLYLVKAIVEASGGKVWFKSEEKKGTSFWFSLPLTGTKAKKGEVSIDS